MPGNFFLKKGRRLPGLMAGFLLLALLASCATRAPAPPSSGHTVQKPYKVMGKWYYPIPDASGYRQKGTASWYGPKFHGKRTANGEKYDMHALTAAHKTLPFGTLVEVRSLQTRRTVVVRINDRGPFVRGRIIDLSNAAAKAVGLDLKGVGPVEIRALASDRKDGGDIQKGHFSVQLGAFTQKANADRMAGNLRREGRQVRLLSHRRGDQTFFRVRVGGYTRLDAAERAEGEFRRQGYADAMAVAD